MSVIFLEEIRSMLDENGIVYWLDYGTLLGAVRGGKMIEWDYDIDLGTLDSNSTLLYKMINNLKNHDINIYLKEENRGIVFEKNGVTIDLCTYHLDRNNASVTIYEPITKLSTYLTFLIRIFSTVQFNRPSLYNILSINYLKHYFIEYNKSKHIQLILTYLVSFLLSPQRKYILNMLIKMKKRTGIKKIELWSPKTLFSSFKWISFYNYQYRVPYKMEEYLVHRYGINWKTPIKKWDTYAFHEQVRPTK